MQQQQLTVNLPPATGELASPVTSSESETDPPSYRAAQQLDAPTTASPTNQGSLDETDEIQVDAAAETAPTVSTPAQTQRDQ